MANQGQKEKIPDVKQYGSTYSSPEPMKRTAAPLTEEEALIFTQRLIDHIAQDRGDGYTYVALVRRIREDLPELLPEYEFRSVAKELPP